MFEFDKAEENLNFENARKYFIKYGLSKQPFLKNILFEKRKNIYLYYGDLDNKYKEYAKSELSEFNITFLDGVGHRILQHEQTVKNLLKESL